MDNPGKKEREREKLTFPISWYQFECRLQKIQSIEVIKICSNITKAGSN